jgi:hypothetical protein
MGLKSEPFVTSGDRHGHSKRLSVCWLYPMHGNESRRVTRHNTAIDHRIAVEGGATLLHARLQSVHPTEYPY